MKACIDGKGLALRGTQRVILAISASTFIGLMSATWFFAVKYTESMIKLNAIEQNQLEFKGECKIRFSKVEENIDRMQTVVTIHDTKLAMRERKTRE